MEFQPETSTSSWGKEFVAGGFAGIAGIISCYPLDTLRIRQQNSISGSVFSILRSTAATEGPGALYRGMSAPLAFVIFQNAMVFQIQAILSRAFDSLVSASDHPSYKGVALGGFGTGALMSIMITPIELVKIQLQLQNKAPENLHHKRTNRGPISVAKNILKTEGLRGMYRGYAITVLRDAPSYGFYFLTYEFVHNKLHPRYRKSDQNSLIANMIAGGLAGVTAWTSCYPIDVIKTRLQAQPHTPTEASQNTYTSIADCFYTSVKQEGYSVLWRGLGTTLTRAFLVSGATFSAYEMTLRCLVNNGSTETENVV